MAAILVEALENAEARNKELEKRIKDLENEFAQQLSALNKCVCCPTCGCVNEEIGARRTTPTHRQQMEPASSEYIITPERNSSPITPTIKQEDRRNQLSMDTCGPIPALDFSGGSEDDAIDLQESQEAPRAETVEAERVLYHEYMATLPVPEGLPPISNHLVPIYGHAKNGNHSVRTHLKEVLGPSRPYIYAPSRLVWCPGEQHALLYCPTHLYDPLWADWWLRAPEASPIGEKRELFVRYEDSTVYVGTYTVLSLRHVHPPGSPAPSEVSGRQLAINAGLGEHGKHSMLVPYFPDAVLPTECFGLQRVGFDEKLYRILQERKDDFKQAQKRKAAAGTNEAEPIQKKKKTRRGSGRPVDEEVAELMWKEAADAIRTTARSCGINVPP
ncbi:hypothetical protein MSAN_01635800 [Mycena sanguinolenta]|uniref:Uncharacterized protein n=1 Tax=Mycena sanguinolenta TaxID=230812 RepID=A0A8H6Y125_9AGAR|nr:hypothetical protein MSAN_01635800 [Mycena sanguinolenta]